MSDSRKNRSQRPSQKSPTAAPASEDSRARELLERAGRQGTLSPSSLRSLLIEDLGAQIQSGLGIHVDDVPASEVVLVTLMPDDSGSIRAAGSEQAIRDGHNLVLEALASSRNHDGLLIHTRYLNGEVLFPYCPLERAVRMSPANYQATLGTPLYDQTVVLLGTVLAKAQEFAEAGVPVRTVTLLMTDGDDQHSVGAQADSVRSLAEDLERAGNHTLAAMGIADGQTDFRAIFREMGIADRWMLTPGSTPDEIRRAFTLFSRSALQPPSTPTALAGFVN